MTIETRRHLYIYIYRERRERRKRGKREEREERKEGDHESGREN